MSLALFCQRMPAAPAKAKVAPGIVGEALRSPGRALERPVRDHFESRFGHDFHRVRIHSDEKSWESARSVQARAYTVGSDIVFGRGEYRPENTEGRRLLAHELAHTVQQGKDTAALGQTENLPISRPGDSAERQADLAAARVAVGPGALAGSTDLGLSGGRRLQRQKEGEPLDPAAQKLSKDVHDAAMQAAQKVHEKGLDKLPEHIPTAPRQRPAPDTKPPDKAKVPVPTSAPEPQKAGTPPGTPAAPKSSEADPGSKEFQLASGIAAQSGPTQAGEQVQGAFQGKNWEPGIAVDFLKYFHLQLGILQPTLSLQLTHLRPVSPGAGSAASPLPPPDTAQLGGTISPAALKVGDFTIAPQIGLATAVAGDVLGKTSGPGKSGTHGQLLGVVNLQIDYPLSKRVSVTGVAGYQGGLDFGPKGTQGSANATGSVLATYHF